MAKQSLLQITLLQTVKLCIPFFFFLSPFYLKCIPLFQVQAHRKHTSAAFFFKHFACNSYGSLFFPYYLYYRSFFPQRVKTGSFSSQLAWKYPSSPCPPPPPQLQKASIGMLGLCELKVLYKRLQVVLLLVQQVACLCYQMDSERIFPHSIGSFLISTSRLQQPSPIFLTLFFHIPYACLFACHLIIARKN